MATNPKIVHNAKVQIEELTGLVSDTVTSLSKTEGGWQLLVDMIELKRIPASTDVLAAFEVSLDEGGNVTGYHRCRRFLRDQVMDEVS